MKSVILLIVAGMFGLLVTNLIGDRIAIALDEGIYIHGAQRILSGQAVYRDFFAFTGPGTFWLYAVLFRLFGVNLYVAHLFLAGELAVMAAALWRWVSDQAGRLAAASSVALFAAVLLAYPNRLYVNHRWDSACCITIAAWLLTKRGSNRTVLMSLSGVCGGLAAVFTPPTLIVGAAVIFFLALHKASRREIIPFTAGLAGPLLISALFLWWSGSLAALVRSVLWAGHSYSQANAVPYGYIPDYEPNATNRGLAFWALRGILEIPAALPVLSLAALAATRLRRVAAPVAAQQLAVIEIGMIAAAYPRLAANQVLFAVPVGLALLFILGSNLLTFPARRRTYLALFCGALTIAIFGMAQLPRLVPVNTELGSAKCRPYDQPNIDFAMRTIQPGEKAFVYPYEPIWYSITGGVNPTHFNFLQPGMMTLEDESAALKQLGDDPPQWILWHSLPQKMVLAIWPHSDPATLRFKRIERFILTHYSRVRPPVPQFHYSIAIFGRKNGP